MLSVHLCGNIKQFFGEESSPRSVWDLIGEYRADFLVLTHVGIKVTQEVGQRRATTYPVEK